MKIIYIFYSRVQTANVDNDTTFECLDNGSIILSKPLDYNKQSFYHYTVSAVVSHDRINGRNS